MIKRALAGDGGGIFGLIPAIAFANYSPYSIFDAFGATSIFAPIAAYYAIGEDPAKLPALLMDYLPDIFHAPWYRNMNPCCSKYPNDALIKFLVKVFGDMPMKHVQKPLYITASDLANKKPKVFSSTGDQDGDVLIRDAILYSVSAPTYFPICNGYADGGLWANCPSAVLAAGLSKTFSMEMKDIAVFSVGTGHVKDDTMDVSGANSWSLIRWAKPLIEYMLDGGSVKGMDFIASQLPLRKYTRWDEVELSPKWEMDDTSILQEVATLAVQAQPSFDKALMGFLSST